MGIYVHIPYCRSKCPYCDFFSLADKSSAQSYISAVNKRIGSFLAENRCEVETLYIGGGTPSVLSGEQIASVIENTKKCCRNSIYEITVECNPSDTDSRFLEAIFNAGANRLSFGMQSADDGERRALGRRAGAKEVEAAVKLAQDIGFKNISLDLMLGIPGQTRESLSRSISFCVNLGVTHISSYILKLEEGTPFFKNRNALDLPDDDETAEFYLQAVEELEKAGFGQYEISNFAIPGAESRHNLKYWNLEEYLGVGASAHSFVAGKRFYYPRDIEYFLSGLEPVSDGEGGDDEEAIMLGLRLKKGIDISLLSERAKSQIHMLVSEGWAIQNENRLSLTPKGFLISNSIINLLT